MLFRSLCPIHLLGVVQALKIPRPALSQGSIVNVRATCASHNDFRGFPPVQIMQLEIQLLASTNSCIYNVRFQRFGLYHGCAAAMKRIDHGLAGNEERTSIQRFMVGSQGASRIALLRRAMTGTDR